MGYKKTHKKINKIKLKKNNKSKRKYKKKGAGQTVSRLRRRRTRNQTPSPPLSTPPSSSGLHDLQVSVLPQADVTITPVVPAITNISNADKPIVKTYSKERINTVEGIMEDEDFGFNELINLELKEELKSALLDYVRHGKNLLTTVKYQTDEDDKENEDVEDKIGFDRKYFEGELIKEREVVVPGELRKLVTEWAIWRNVNKIKDKEAYNDLLDKLKSSENTKISYYNDEH